MSGFEFVASEVLQRERWSRTKIVTSRESCRQFRSVQVLRVGRYLRDKLFLSHSHSPVPKNFLRLFAAFRTCIIGQKIAGQRGKKRAAFGEGEKARMHGLVIAGTVLALMQGNFSRPHYACS